MFEHELCLISKRESLLLEEYVEGKVCWQREKLKVDGVHTDKGSSHGWESEWK